MGKGDIKTRKGKIVNGSYGNKRRRKLYVTAIEPYDENNTASQKPKAKRSKATK